MVRIPKHLQAKVDAIKAANAQKALEAFAVKKRDKAKVVALKVTKSVTGVKTLPKWVNKKTVTLDAETAFVLNLVAVRTDQTPEQVLHDALRMYVREVTDPDSLTTLTPHLRDDLRAFVDKVRKEKQ